MTTPINSSSSQAVVTNTVNGISREVENMKSVQVFKDDTGTRRVLFGKGPNGFYGGKVSQEGVDVWDATDDQLVFNSDNNLFKIIDTGTVTIPEMTVTAGSLGVSTIDETFDEMESEPMVLAFAQIGGDPEQIPKIKLTSFSVSTSAITFSQISEYDFVAKTTFIRFIHRFYNGTAVDISKPAVTVRYYILEETSRSD